MEMAEKGRNAPGAYDVPIEEVNPLNARLAREIAGRNTSLACRRGSVISTNRDLRPLLAICKWAMSALSTATGRPTPPPAASPSGCRSKMRGEVLLGGSAFIAWIRPPTEQRKTVRSVSAPSNLRNIEPMIRERTAALLDSPRGETSTGSTPSRSS